MALDTHKGPIQEHFRNIQYGFKTPNGIKIIVHSTNVSHQIHPDWDRVFIDLKNAFNNVIRKHAIRNIVSHFPMLSRYAIAFYGLSTELWYSYFDEENYFMCEQNLSEEGAQQGDSFGPFLFSMGAYPYFVEADRIAGSGIYKARRVLKSVKFFLFQGLKYGFYLNPLNTKILSGVCDDPKDAVSRTSNFNELLQIPKSRIHCNIMIHPSNSSDINDINDLCGARFLGSPVESDKFIENWLDGRMIKIEGIMDHGFP